VTCVNWGHLNVILLYIAFLSCAATVRAQLFEYCNIESHRVSTFIFPHWLDGGLMSSCPRRAHRSLPIKIVVYASDLITQTVTDTFLMFWLQNATITAPARHVSNMHDAPDIYGFLSFHLDHLFSRASLTLLTAYWSKAVRLNNLAFCLPAAPQDPFSFALRRCGIISPSPLM